MRMYLIKKKKLSIHWGLHYYDLQYAVLLTLMLSPLAPFSVIWYKYGLFFSNILAMIWSLKHMSMCFGMCLPIHVYKQRNVSDTRGPV